MNYTHSSDLRTMQEIFRVGPLLGDAVNAERPLRPVQAGRGSEEAVVVARFRRINRALFGGISSIYFGAGLPARSTRHSVAPRSRPRSSSATTRHLS